MTPPHSTPTLCTESWKFSKYFWTFKGKKLKSLRRSQKSFLDNKKITEDFPYVGGGGRPTYGKFHMFRRFYFWKLPLTSIASLRPPGLVRSSAQPNQITEQFINLKICFQPGVLWLDTSRIQKCCEGLKYCQRLSSYLHYPCHFPASSSIPNGPG